MKGAPMNEPLKRAERLEMLRISLKLNKTQFAAKLGMSPASYGNYLARGLTEKAITEFAVILNVRRDWFDENTPVECADKNAPHSDVFSPWQFIQNFIALSDDERDQFVATLQKLLTVKK